MSRNLYPLDANAPNVLVGKLGEIAREVGDPNRKDVGDTIDRGLILLRVLREHGFVVAVKP